MLAKALKFTNDDLFANRDGTMTQEQRKRLRRIGFSHYLPSIIGSIIFGTAFILSLLVFLTGLRDDQLTFLLAIFGFMSLWLAKYAYVQWRKVKADLEKGEVKMVAGRVRFHIFGVGSRMFKRTLRIEREQFRVSKPVLLAFNNHERYRIYYARHTKMLLSAVPVPANEPLPEAFQLSSE